MKSETQIKRLKKKNASIKNKIFMSTLFAGNVKKFVLSRSQNGEIQWPVGTDARCYTLHT